MSRIRVALFSARTAAEPVRQALAQAGIGAELHEELGLAKLWFVPRGAAGVRLEVPARQFERATELLHEWAGQSGLLRQAVRCPECGSLRVAYPQVTDKSLLTNLLMGLAAGLKLVERGFYCEDCHYLWAKSGGKPRRPRTHMAPNYFLEADEPSAFVTQGAVRAEGRSPTRSSPL